MLSMKAKGQQFLVGLLVSFLLHMLSGTCWLGFFLKSTFLWYVCEVRVLYSCSDHIMIFFMLPVWSCILFMVCWFQVSIALLTFCPVYMQFFLVETVTPAPKKNQVSGFCSKVVDVLHKRYKSMRNAAEIVIFRLFDVMCCYLYI